MGNLNFHVQTFCLRRVQNSINNCHTTHRLPYKHCTAYHLSISGNFNPLKTITISSVLVSLDTNFLLRCFFPEDKKQSRNHHCWTVGLPPLEKEGKANTFEAEFPL